MYAKQISRRTPYFTWFCLFSTQIADLTFNTQVHIHASLRMPMQVHVLVVVDLKANAFSSVIQDISCHCVSHNHWHNIPFVSSFCSTSIYCVRYLHSIYTSLRNICIIYHLSTVRWQRQKESSLQWRHDEHDGVSNHRRLDCLLNRLFKETIKAPRHRALWREFTGDRRNSSPEGPVTWKSVSFHDVIMLGKETMAR